MFGLPPPKQKGLMGLLGTMPMNEANPGAMSLFQQQAAPMAPQMGQAMSMDQHRAMTPQQPHGPGFFGEGGIGRGIAGAIGDWALQNSGMQPVYAPAMQERRMMAQRQAMAQQERQQGREDYAWQHEFDATHPKPFNNDTVNDYNFILEKQGPEAANQYLRNLGDPTVTVPIGNKVYTGPRSGLGTAMQGQMQPQGPQPGAVEDGHRFKGGDPANPANWEPVGGGAGNGTGGFPVNSNQLDRVTIQAESAGNPNAVSPVGARGLWQVMPATARDPGFGIRPSNGTPQDDARVGAEYRRAMEKRYNGDLAAMWGAYNWGPGHVDAAIAKHGPNWLDHAPAETKNYVRRNMRAVRGN